MDGRSFAKLCKDCRLFDRGFTAVDADLIFKKVLAGSGQRKMDLSKFEFALQLVAERKAMEPSDVLAVLAESSGPEALRAEAVISPRPSSAEITKAELARHLYGPHQLHGLRRRGVAATMPR